MKNTSNINILLLTNRVPFPLKDGGALATDNLLCGLLDTNFNVSLLSFNTKKHFVNTDSLPSYYSKLSLFKTDYVNNSPNFFSAFINLFDTRPYHVTRFTKKSFEKKLKEILAANNFDFVYFDSIYLAEYLSLVKEHSNAITLCRLHNIEHIIWQRTAKNEKSLLKKWYLKYTAKKIKQYELRLFNQFNYLLPISINDLQVLKQLINKTNFYHLPFAIKNINTHSETNTKKDFYHIGSMDWLPNKEAVDWLINDIWEQVIERNPNKELHIAGKNMPSSYCKIRKRGVFIHAEVPDAIEFSKQHGVLLVPLKSGSGIRIKIIEAMALGKTIITTSVGAEGIGATHMENIVFANTTQDFVNAILMVDEITEKIGKNAKEFILKNYDYKTIYVSFASFLQSIIKKGEKK